MAPHSADVMGPLLDAAVLAQLCVEAGWPAAVRESGLAMVELDAGHTRYHARLDAAGSGGLRATVDLCSVSGCSPASRSAIEALLLATSAAVRQVRHTFASPDEAEWAGLTATCTDAAAPEALDRALSALTVACRMAGREAQALLHEAIALEYLAWRALDPPEEPEEVVVFNQRNLEEITCLQQP